MNSKSTFAWGHTQILGSWTFHWIRLVEFKAQKNLKQWVQRITFPELCWSLTEQHPQYETEKWRNFFLTEFFLDSLGNLTPWNWFKLVLGQYYLQVLGWSKSLCILKERKLQPGSPIIVIDNISRMMSIT